MGWLRDEEVEAIKTTNAEEIAPCALEFLYLSQRLKEQKAQERAVELLTAFKAIEPEGCSDSWYGQLEHLHAVAVGLEDEDAQRHSVAVNAAVREASRRSVRVVRTEEQKKLVREEAHAMEKAWPSGQAETVPLTKSMQAPASDLVEVFMQGGPLVCQRVMDAGYRLERKPLGRQGAVPSPQKLSSIKERCIAELSRCTTFVNAVNAGGSGDVVAQFRTTIHSRFNLDLFCARGSDGISVSNLYTMLPKLLEARHKESEGPMCELVGRFLAFRTDLGTMCNPLESYMPIFEAIFELFRHTDSIAGVVKERGEVVLVMFRCMFSAVLDLLAGSVEVLGRALGAGLGILVGAVGAGLAEAASAAGAVGLGPAASFVAGAGACVVAVRGLIYLVDCWVKHGNHVRVCALYRRSEAGAWRLWVVELFQ